MIHYINVEPDINVGGLLMKRGNIAVFITGVDSEAWKSILGGIEERAREEDYNVSIFSCAGSYDIRRKFDI